MAHVDESRAFSVILLRLPAPVQEQGGSALLHHLKLPFHTLFPAAPQERRIFVARERIDADLRGVKVISFGSRSRISFTISSPVFAAMCNNLFANKCSMLRVLSSLHAVRPDIRLKVVTRRRTIK
jgi:hypothetical protein